MDGRNCYSDEHYLPTFFYMIDPDGIANWSVTHVDWSEGKWHPKSYRAQDVTYELMKNITVHVWEVTMAVDGYTDVLFLLCFYIISAIVLIVELLADSYVVLYCSLLIKVCTLQVTKGRKSRLDNACGMECRDNATYLQGSSCRKHLIT
ncbi:core-2/I-branching beta-1,6-N-acetylglucosaminyltransferase family protein [Actinidia rufa]|uniref:Core-2/I-branching beta-1,6-N-acetylglucosaminyltransferase family protein n=1 Tax=Actinidia rufa TaxID=165716 RepID=A0A7J0E2N4_9ERIC|nr:core-2/I-branching beta-1,6-N-acetylglucosaminyltransferase family protein [Actinidia rufa]